MDYPFENLNPEKFQEFAQALLNTELPELQCLPVAQPDGGRDILTYELGKKYKSFAVYQVKYVRKPLAEKDPHKWLLTVMKQEAPKIKKLIDKGAKQFFLITNVPGTAHQGSGSIDQMNQILEDELGITSICWWRDDLNRKLDNAWNLKWTYPELMTGPDLIRALIESGLSENQEKRSNAIRAFVVEQFYEEQVVKFKQVELQNRLLDLFIDVPILSPQNAENGKKSMKYQNLYEYISHTSKNTAVDEINELRFYINERNRMVGSATFLLHPLTQKDAPWIVLEGAPGQGKSTITQYLCQIHRMRLLGPEEIKKHLPENNRESEGLNIIPEYHVNSRVCLPFRVDLRDLASWLSGNNPFVAKSNVTESSNNNQSLEEFLALFVMFKSGGLDFSASDLIAIVKRTPVLLVFDGLDEVADMEKRREVVSVIHVGSRRLKVHALSLQVIVTSRPAAFDNSPGLPEDDFPRYCLGSLNKPLIDEYANKWMSAKRLDNRDRSEVKKILRDKLDQPHLKDLAKNPMQLTILLSLINNRGSSLPDKRTALYDSYVELFFNREAEKTPVVKKYRDLLLNIHKYIAWLLHSEAEQHGKNGSITQSELYSSIQKYLQEQGHEGDLAEELVSGALERIVALVSRVEGTYEFEVQPLREYFAAKYLYETALHSSSNQKFAGTKPDRFDAISRNFYWLNVTRFYAGCYDVGELPSLTDRLEELIDSPGYSLISHPRILAATLLSDWVFSQHPRSVKKVMKLILDGIGLRYVLPSSSRRMGKGEPMVIPPECGRDELIKYCFDLLTNRPPLDFAQDIIQLIHANSLSSEEIFRFWLKTILSENGEGRKIWLEYGLYLGILGQPEKLPLNELDKICSDLPNDRDRLLILYKASRFDYFEARETQFKAGLEIILTTNFSENHHHQRDSILYFIGSALSASRYTLAFREPRPIPLTEMWKRYSGFRKDNFFFESIPENSHICSNFGDAQKCLIVIDVVKKNIQLDAQTWATSLFPWSNLVESIRQCWGDVWIGFHLANISSGIKSTSETCTDFSDLLDTSKDLCKRARYARLRAGQESWWTKQIDRITSECETSFILLILVTWGSRKTLEKMIDKIDYLIQSLSETAWRNLYNSIEESLGMTQVLDHMLIEVTQIPHLLNFKTAALISLRSKLGTRKSIYLKYLRNYDGSDTSILKLCNDMSLELLVNDYSMWDEVRDVIQRSYKKGIVFEPFLFYHFSKESTNRNIPDKIAEEIASDPNSYPGFLVAMAEIKLKELVASRVVPVGETAIKDAWFSHL